MRTLYILLLFTLSDCASGPKITVCTVSAKYGKFYCYNEATGQSNDIPFVESDPYHFACLNSTDLMTLLNFCAAK